MDGWCEGCGHGTQLTCCCLAQAEATQQIGASVRTFALGGRRSTHCRPAGRSVDCIRSHPGREAGASAPRALLSLRRRCHCPLQDKRTSQRRTHLHLLALTPERDTIRCRAWRGHTACDGATTRSGGVDGGGPGGRSERGLRPLRAALRRGGHWGDMLCTNLGRKHLARRRTGGDWQAGGRWGGRNLRGELAEMRRLVGGDGNWEGRRLRSRRGRARPAGHQAHCSSRAPRALTAAAACWLALVTEPRRRHADLGRHMQSWPSCTAGNARQPSRC